MTIISIPVELEMVVVLVVGAIAMSLFSKTLTPILKTVTGT